MHIGAGQAGEGVHWIAGRWVLPFSPTPDDLLVLRVMGVGQHLLRLLGGTSGHQKAHPDARGLAGNGAVRVQDVLDVLGNLLVFSAQGREAWRGSRSE